MRINILQHSPNEGPGFIKHWAIKNNHEIFVYHPYHFNGILPTPAETDLLVILGGAMSPNDEIFWIKKERLLIQELLDRNIPIFGICYGAQQIAKTLGCQISKAPNKEVGWAPVQLESSIIKGIPKYMTVLHWHEDTFEIPEEAELLFRGNLLVNQGFLLRNVIGLQFHLETTESGLTEMVINDFLFPISSNALNQTPKDILTNKFPLENKNIISTLLDYIARWNDDSLA